MRKGIWYSPSWNTDYIGRVLFASLNSLLVSLARNMSFFLQRWARQTSQWCGPRFDSSSQRTLLWAKDALNGNVTRYNYKQNDLSNFFSKTVTLFKHKMSYIKHKFENSYQFSPRPLYLRTSAAIIEEAARMQSPSIGQQVKPLPQARS